MTSHAPDTLHAAYARLDQVRAEKAAFTAAHAGRLNTEIVRRLGALRPGTPEFAARFPLAGHPTPDFPEAA